MRLEVDLFGLAPAGLSSPVLLGNEAGVKLCLLGLHQLGQGPANMEFKKHCVLFIPGTGLTPLPHLPLYQKWALFEKKVHTSSLH